MGLTPRIKRRISKDYSAEDREAVEEILLELMGDLEEGGGAERVAAATLIHGQGQVDRFLIAVQVARRDWRDILMNSGLEYGDWPERLESEFGTNA
ncbi:hypothetical protein [Streptomyces roseochromogenus]|uniref:hypothetical protein n=1 Tax=Streptomyces roseochromogenus TaxID=285450 RepID=UPI0009972363|nr:hypothetical protein [Streptomyces roseochromogenus]